MTAENPIGTITWAEETRGRSIVDNLKRMVHKPMHSCITVSEAKDIGDSLRMDVDTSTPEQETIMLGTVNDHIQVIESNFGEFIPDDAKQRAKITAYNTIIARDISRVRRFWKDKKDDWFGILENDGFADMTESPNARGHHLIDGGVRVSLIKSPEQDWPEFPKEKKKEIKVKLKKFGLNISPREWFFVINVFKDSAHELVHAYADPSLPYHVNEFFAYAMGNFMMVKQFGVNYSDDKLNGLYQDMVAKYGDDFYRTMFGSMRNPITRRKIFRDLSYGKVREVLPSGSLD